MKKRKGPRRPKQAGLVGLVRPPEHLINKDSAEWTQEDEAEWEQVSDEIYQLIKAAIAEQGNES